jgi:DNA-binding NarL/FixJ family response regulator
MRGRRLMIVEDEYLVARDLAGSLRELGVEVVGPAGTVNDALLLLEAEGTTIDAAVLDINLREDRVYPVADALTRRGVPFVFATGYDVLTIPETYATVPRCEKPVDKAELVRLLTNEARR